MPFKVTLKASSGDWREEFVFDDRDSCLIGRHEDCRIRVPNEIDLKISRRHCLIDVNPPDIRIRDYGSMNGTWINGTMIGQREQGQSPEEGAQLAQAGFSDHDLGHRDELKLGDTLFKVDIYVPAVCGNCEREIPDAEKSGAEVRASVHQCAECRQKAQAALRKAAPKPKAQRCAKCGCDVSNEVGQNRHGEYICISCKADPFKILRHLLDLAKSGRRDLIAIEGYTVEKELGRGGMGAVYLARHNRTAERVALKVMLPQVAADQRGKETFLREVENTKVLSHEHIAGMRDFGCSEGVFFFTLEFCERGSVDKFMERRGGRLSLKEAATITIHTLKGLEYAHLAKVRVKLKNGSYGDSTGLIHRDLKPQNVFLADSDGKTVAKIGDFGLSKAFDAAGLSGHTMTGRTAGTPVFMPRQQVLNFKYAQPDIDVWAAAACLYHMLTGQFPRDFHCGQDVWQTVIENDPVPIRNRDPSLPKRLAEVIDTALRDKPRIGFETATDFRQAIEEAL